MLVLDTRMKLLLLVLINFLVFGMKNFMLGSICFAAICILCFLMGTKRNVLKYIIIYGVIAILQYLSQYIPQPIHSIITIFTLFVRVMLPVVLFASTFIATTKVSELIAAMYMLHIPRSVTITFAMVLRFFPTFREEMNQIFAAMKLRGITIKRPVVFLEAVFIPIIMRSASIAEKLAASAVTRGIDNPNKRSSFVVLKMQIVDYVVLAIFLILTTILFYMKYQIYGRL